MPDKLSAEEIAKLPEGFRSLAALCSEYCPEETISLDIEEIWFLLRWVAEHHQEESKP